MAQAPDTSSYLLYSPDSSDLPNSRVLEAGAGLALLDTGPSGTLTIQPLGNIESIFNYAQTGYVLYNADTQIFSPASIAGNNSITVTNPNGTTGQTQIAVNNNTTNQQVQVELNGLLISQRKTVNFIPQSFMSITVNDNGNDDRADVYFNVVGETTGTVTSVAANSPFGSLHISGSPITTAGTLSFDLINQPLVSPGTYEFPVMTVNQQGVITNVVEGSGPGPGPGGRRVVNLTPAMSPYYVTSNDFMMNVTSLSSETQMHIILPAINPLLVGKEYIIKDSSGQATEDLFITVTVAEESELSYSIGGNGSIEATGTSEIEYSAHGVEMTMSMANPTVITFEDSYIIGPEVSIGGSIDDTSYYYMTTPYSSLSVIGISNPPNTWAII